MSSSKKIAFVTLGCKLNYAETASYERAFIKEGLEVVPWQQPADIYVVNTCSVTERADQKSRSEIRKLHRISPDALIAVTGCSAELRREQIQKIPGVTYVFGAEAKSELVPTILGRDLPEEHKAAFFEAYSSGEDRTRAFLKVQDGCNNYCAYCTVPYARGQSRNVSVCEVIRQAREIAASGIKEIVLTGVNTGDFGRSTGETFLDLLRALNEVEDIERYRISSIEPNLITEELIDYIASSGTKFLPHFHIPLQNGTDELLKKMGRRYSTQQFADKVNYIRSRMGEQVFFGFDVMVGLPGETDELFERSRAFIESLHPAYLHIFPYSRRPGTRAASMPEQVPDRVKTERVKVLEELCERLNQDFLQSNKGREEQVLWESTERDGQMSGYTRNYIRLTRPYDPALIGQITKETI